MKVGFASLATILVAAPVVAAGVPRSIDIGQGVEGRIAGAKGDLDCYQIDAPKGGAMVVSIKPTGFAPLVQVLRGAQCDADVPQYEADGAADGRSKLRTLAAGLPLVEQLTGAELGAAFGREHVVHAAVAPGRIAQALIADAARLAGFRSGPRRGEAGFGE